MGKRGWKVDIRAYDVVTYDQKMRVGGPAIPAYEVTRSFIDAGTVASILTNAKNGESDQTLNDLATGSPAPGRSNFGIRCSTGCPPPRSLSVPRPTSSRYCSRSRPG